MRRFIILLAGTLAFAVSAEVQAQERVFRCVIDGKTTFQQRACDAKADGQVIEVKPGNVIASPPRSTASPSAAVQPAPAAALNTGPAKREPLQDEIETCLAYLQPLLRDPRSAYATGASRDGRVLSMTLHAANSQGVIVTRPAACELFNAVVDAGWTRIHLQRLGWFQPRVLILDRKHRRHAPRELLDDIELPQN